MPHTCAFRSYTNSCQCYIESLWWTSWNKKRRRTTIMNVRYKKLHSSGTVTNGMNTLQSTGMEEGIILFSALFQILAVTTAVLDWLSSAVIGQLAANHRHCFIESNWFAHNSLCLVRYCSLLTEVFVVSSAELSPSSKADVKFWLLWILICSFVTNKHTNRSDENQEHRPTFWWLSKNYPRTYSVLLMILRSPQTSQIFGWENYTFLN